MALDTDSGRALLPGPHPLKELTMKIEITRRCRIKGKKYFPGDVVDTDRNTALDRIGMGRAKLYVPPAAPPPPEAPSPADASEAAPEADVPKGRRGPRKSTEEQEP
jgi:hypothetical protein